MTPFQLSNILRHIATEIDNSTKPSKHAIIASLRDIITKLAGRTKTLDMINHILNKAGIQPNMKQIGPETYKGELDTGWVLEVEKTGRDINVRLNNNTISSIDAAINAFKSKNPRYKKYIQDPLIKEMIEDVIHDVESESFSVVEKGRWRPFSTKIIDIDIDRYDGYRVIVEITGEDTKLVVGMKNNWHGNTQSYKLLRSTQSVETSTIKQLVDQICDRIDEYGETFS